MKSIIILTFGIFIFTGVFAQSGKVDQLISEGVALHDQGKYKQAISKYEAALRLDKKSTLANYEIAYSYFMIKEYNKAIKHGNVVLKQNGDNQHEAYVVLGNSYDMLGKPAKAIKYYEEGLEKFPESYMLNYNLGLTTYNQRDYEKAEEAAINAIEINPDHGSSHILLAVVMDATSNRIKAILSLYYFLLLEPESKRAEQRFENLLELLGQGVSKRGDKTTVISMSPNALSGDELGSAELSLTILASLRNSEVYKDKSDAEFFAVLTNQLFSMLGEMKEDKSGFWWDFYITKFEEMNKAGHSEAFAYYISQSRKSKEVTTWLENNEAKVKAFDTWKTKEF